MATPSATSSLARACLLGSTLYSSFLSLQWLTLSQEPFLHLAEQP